MGGVDFLNLEYLILMLARGFEGGAVFVASLPVWVIGLVQAVMVLGAIVAFILLILIVYVQIRLHQVEHEGFHMLEEEAHARAEPEVETRKGNERWERIVELANGASEGDWRRSILEADIMLGDMLGEIGYPGTSVGEQLRHANPIQMTTLDLAWKAHKIRNDVAHQGETMELNERDVRATIDYYKRVFEELGAI
ncbi:MAG: hypothetical protein AAB964_02640 [Patescibacteria group bacterium]